MILRIATLSHSHLNRIMGDTAEEEVLTLWETPFVRTAISAASPTLACALHSEGFGVDGAAFVSLVRYSARMASRPTPFGLMAAIATAKVGDTEPKVVFTDDTSTIAVWRPVEAADLAPEPNGPVELDVSVFKSSGRTKWIRNAPGHRDLVATVDTEVLDAAIEALRPRTAADATSLSGADQAALLEIGLAARRAPLQLALEQPTIDHVGPLPPALPLDGGEPPRMLFRRRPTISSVPNSDIDELCRATVAVESIVGTPSTSRLYAFCNAAWGLYGGRPVNFAELAHGDAGLAFDRISASTPISRLVGQPTTSTRQRDTTGGSLADLIRLDEADIDLAAISLPVPPRRLGHGAVLAELIGDPDVAFVWRNMFRPGAAKFLGRLAARDGDVAEALRRIVVSEGPPAEGEWAEVLFAADAKSANVLQRLSVYRRAIQLTSCAVPRGTLVTRLFDLVAVVSEDRELRLYDQRDGTRLNPRISVSHFHPRHDNDRTYRILAAIETSQGGSFSWSWGDYNAQPALPRVRHGRVVVAPRVWTVDPTALAESPSALARWADEVGLPDLVRFREADRGFALRPRTPLGHRVLEGLGRRHRRLRLEETWEPRVVRDEQENYFTSEIIVPVKDAGVIARARPQSRTSAGRQLGQDLVSARLFVNHSDADWVLQTHVCPLLDDLIVAPAAWYYLRHSEGGPHLRIRVTKPGRTWTAVVAAMAGMAASLDLKLHFDTHRPEVSRYGGAAGVAFAEALYAVDSAVVLARSRVIGRSSEWLAPGLVMNATLLLEALMPSEDRGRFLTEREQAAANEFDARSLARHAGLAYRAVGRQFVALWRDPPRPLDEWRAEARARYQAVARQLPIEGTAFGLRWGTLAASYLHLHLNRSMPPADRFQEAVMVQTVRRCSRALLESA